jgi:hypothetical protein
VTETLSWTTRGSLRREARRPVLGKRAVATETGFRTVTSEDKEEAKPRTQVSLEITGKDASKDWDPKTPGFYVCDLQNHEEIKLQQETNTHPREPHPTICPQCVLQPLRAPSLD